MKLLPSTSRRRDKFVAHRSYASTHSAFLILSSPRGADAAEPRVVNSNLKTFPQPNNIYTRPVRKTTDGDGGTVTVVAE